MALICRFEQGSVDKGVLVRMFFLILDIKECADSRICPSGSECVEMHGGYHCIDRQGKHL